MLFGEELWMAVFFFYKMIHRSPKNPLFPPVCTNLFSFLHPSFFPRRLCEHLLSSLSFILMHSQIQDKVLINNQGLVNLGHETLVLSLYVQRWNVWFWNRLKTMCDCVKRSVCRVRSQVFLSSLCAAMFSSRFSTKVCLYFLYFVLYRKDHNLFVCLFCCHVWPAATPRLRFLLEFFAVFI